MNYEIVTFRWPCPECDSPLHLHFSPVPGPEEGEVEEFLFDRVFCGMGHVLPEDLFLEIRPEADQEFALAMERGLKVSEIWAAPAEDPENQSASPDVPSDTIPPEEP
jgi:hypothetical protein